MSRMLPPVYDESVKSFAERRVFELLKNTPGTERWVCLHSLGLSRHVGQKYGEIDFVVLIPGGGIFCLEIKGGSVSRQDGRWAFTNRYGETTTREKGPFMQARDNMFSLMKQVRERLDHFSPLQHTVYGWGVLFPDIPWTREEPDAEPWQIYDRDFRRPITEFLGQLIRKTQASLPDKQPPTVEDVEEFVNCFRGDFETVEAPAHRVSSLDDQIRRLTEEQFRCLDQLARNPRCLFEGGAGTGKTLLALEAARRTRADHARVLLLCYNKMLGAWLEGALPKECFPHVTAGHYHGVLEGIIAASSLDTEYRAARAQVSGKGAVSEFFREQTPLYASAALAEGVCEPFDLLIVDEGQDLLDPAALDVMDALLKGGLAGGRWFFFCDLHRQAIYAGEDGANGNATDALRSRLSLRAPSHVEYLLTVNCRNTKPICEETALLSGFETPPFLPSHLEGTSVDYRFWGDAAEQEEKLRQLLASLRRDGIPAGAIHILSPVSREQSIVGRAWDRLPYPVHSLVPQDVSGAASHSDSVGFTTIQAYKGLENAVIILTDITSLTRARDQSLLYVGMSRARQRLIVLLSEGVRQSYEEAVRTKLMKGRTA